MDNEYKSMPELREENKQLKERTSEEINRLRCSEDLLNNELTENKDIVQKVRELYKNINPSELDAPCVDILNELKEILKEKK